MDNDKAEEALETLEQTCSILWNAKTGTVPTEVLARLPLSLVSLDHQSVTSGLNVRYFIPWKEGDLRRYERNLAPVEGNERISCEENILLNGCPIGYRLSRPWGSGGEWAETMCSRLLTEVDIAPRKGTQGDMLALKSVTGWRHHIGIPDEPPIPQPWYIQRESYQWGPYCYWTLRGNKHPHVKASMFHGVDGTDGMVLREEIMVIILVMISRLENKDFRKHAVVPVMLFSFMRNRRGRILFAHCLGNRLVIEMSPLCPFEVEGEGWNDSLALFTRYQAAVPSSTDTTKFPVGPDGTS
ncbi:hypothetical protein BO85DRAFT_369246 [Aspergillus piperis CBS 112811]|uniref:Uncharacterized protein n=1 Tax=Aspergillus piperis CBS 112811 TaxID=1448313 RepID=A0A8G1VNL3_9EURO|nr:hypothetical protein BO85DRAFT_369246 [Aspergillus piperis CBS 112811]RAH58910.1 hypothetical protein BO85DRAFT_369246 [Aspergillus piperis CBS 112811]